MIQFYKFLKILFHQSLLMCYECVSEAQMENKSRGCFPLCNHLTDRLCETKIWAIKKTAPASLLQTILYVLQTFVALGSARIQKI